jgi:hypothetical protein
MPAVIEGVRESDTNNHRATDVAAPVVDSTDWINASFYDGIWPR